jgi:hypothetical protein
VLPNICRGFVLFSAAEDPGVPAEQKRAEAADCIQLFAAVILLSELFF